MLLENYKTIMEIKKFETYTYRGPELLKLTRKNVIEEIVDFLADGKIFGYNINGPTYFNVDEVLWIHIDKEDENGKWIDNKILKLDLSDVGIEIGTAKWNDDTEDFEEFIPELNLDTDITKKVKKFKKNIKNFNV